MTKYSALTLFILFLGASGAEAQDQNQKLPSQPFVASVPDTARWNVTVSYPQDRGEPVSVPEDALKNEFKTMSFERTGDLYHSETVYASGRKNEYWQSGISDYYWGWDSKIWSITTEKGEARPIIFDNVEWLGTDNYLGIMTYSGHRCLVFGTGGPQGFKLSGDDASQIDQLNEVALIDAQTRLPVEIRLGSTYYQYRFVDPPSDKLVLPADLAQQIEKQEKEMAAFNHIAPPDQPVLRPAQSTPGGQ